MDLEHAQRMAEGLLGEFGLTGDLFGAGAWSFSWNRRKRALGLCRYGSRRIELSIYFVRDNDERQVRETILHEIAHALAGEKAGHGPRWKRMCARVGCKPERCDKGEARMPPGRWRANCPGCGKGYSRHQRPKKAARYWCPGCGSERGALRFFLALNGLPVTAPE